MAPGPAHAVLRLIASSLATSTALAHETATKPFKCGFRFDCPRNYTVDQVVSMAALWDPSNSESKALLDRVSKTALDNCNAIAHSNDGKFVSEASACQNGQSCQFQGISKSGGWCLRVLAMRRHFDQYDLVRLDNGQTYYLPHPHLAPDYAIVQHLARLLKVCRDPPACRDATFLSLNDFGAGVGQYGRALRAMDPRYRYTGYDGAGNIEEVSRRFINFFDLTIPLSLPRADWLMSLEVGEHIPSRFEAMVIRNLHAHNCRGVILSWAYLGKMGVGHVNNHASSYLTKIFDELGYNLNWGLTAQLRANRSKSTGKVPSSRSQSTKRMLYGVRNVSRNWFWLKSVHVFERRVPVKGHGCTADTGTSGLR